MLLDNQGSVTALAGGRDEKWLKKSDISCSYPLRSRTFHLIFYKVSGFLLGLKSLFFGGGAHPYWIKKAFVVSKVLKVVTSAFCLLKSTIQQ